ncbi:MAG: hypothetical protein ACXW4B_06500 [Micavibrio sp.]
MKKRNILRAVFYGATLSFITTQFANTAVVANSNAEKTDEIAAALGTTKGALKAYAKSNFLILDPAEPATRRYFKIALKSDQGTNSLPTIGFNAEAIQNQWGGYGSHLDRAMGGLGSKLWPCVVVLSPDTITRNNMQEMVSFVDSTFARHMPGRDTDYLKITVLHELEHCRHITNQGTGLVKEYQSDQRALTTYLAQSGDMDVVRGWIYFRANKALEHALFFETGLVSTNEYAMAPALYDQFIARKNTGANQESLEDLQGAYLDVAYVIEEAAKKYIVPVSSLKHAETLHYVISRVLKDPSQDLNEDMRRVLQLNKDAYEFLSQPPSAPAKIPAPGVS